MTSVGDSCSSLSKSSLSFRASSLRVEPLSFLLTQVPHLSLSLTLSSVKIFLSEGFPFHEISAGDLLNRGTELFTFAWCPPFSFPATLSTLISSLSDPLTLEGLFKLYTQPVTEAA